MKLKWQIMRCHQKCCWSQDPESFDGWVTLKKAVQTCIERYLTNYKSDITLNHIKVTWTEFRDHMSLKLINHPPDCERWYILISLYISVAVSTIQTFLFVSLLNKIIIIVIFIDTAANTKHFLRQIAHILGRWSRKETITMSEQEMEILLKHLRSY